MSLQIIRKALEKRLAALAPALTTAHQNAPFSPVEGTPYQRVNLLPASPDNETLTVSSYFEDGIFQITLAYPQLVGPAAAEARAELTRLHFRRGTTMVEGGISVQVPQTPRVSPAIVEDNRYNIPISVPYRAHVVI